MNEITLEKLQSMPEYDFLWDFSFLPESSTILLLGLGGSHAYGTATETSDIDLRGIFLPAKKDLLGIVTPKDVLINNTTDTVLYSFPKFCKLLAQCNPNIFEIIGKKKDKDFIVYQPFQKFLDDYLWAFLSKRIFVTFRGYAISQLRRLENALARDQYPAQKKEEHILKSLDASIIDSRDKLKEYDKENYIHLYMGKSEKEDLDEETYIDIFAKNIPLRDYMGINNEMMNTLRNFGKLNHRNRKKDDNHLYKHAMHLIRLYYMLKDLALEHKIITYREKEHDELMKIRLGEISFDEVFEINSKLEQESKQWENECDLPDKPNLKILNDAVADFINNESLFGVIRN
jgi:predicted nucleotidyltransferase